jgi:hypothetical protein
VGQIWKFAGIDVGGKRTGFHLVGLSEDCSLQSRHIPGPIDAIVIVKSLGARIVAVDASVSHAS